MEGPLTNVQTFAASKTPITDQLIMLRKKAKPLKTEETILGKHVVDQIINLRRILRVVEARLHGVERTAINSSRVSEDWLEKVYTNISLADDLLDECEYYKHHHSLALRSTNNKSILKVRKYLEFSSSSLDLWMSNMARRLTLINNTLRTTRDEGVGLFLAPVGDAGERSASLQGMVDASEIELKIVGKENEVHKIVEELLYADNVEYLSYLSLVGWGHTGKTALAQMVYKSVEVMFHFDERMWVQVPQDDTDVYTIAKGMLTTLTRDRPDEVLTLEKISQSLQKRPKGRRYLLVLAGMPQVNSTSLLPLITLLQDLGGSRGCKILTTTGKIEPTGSSFVYFTHKMQSVSTKYCLALFNNISRSEILDKCPRDSWSLKILASLKNRIEDENRWLEIKEASQNWTDAPRDNTRLCFSYMSSLPLKRCLQYCSVFPKGHLIQKEELIHLWMAQGYLNLPTSNIPVLEMEALGLLYYEILIRCCFLQVSEDDDFDGESCKMPPLLHDVVVSRESRDCCKTLENLEKEVIPKDVHFSRTCCTNLRTLDCWKSVHLSLIKYNVRFSKEAKKSFSKLRTLRLENTGALKDFLDCVAEALRVLIVVEDSMEELPGSIGRLICLKYLDISRTQVVSLPDSISLLYNLQTLKLYALEYAPKNFENLVSLRHLYIQKDLATLNVFPPKLQGWVKLWHSKASFKVFLDKHGAIDMSEKLKALNTCLSISIHGLENAKLESVRDETAGIVKKYGIESLKLHWSARRASSYYNEDHILEMLEPNGCLENLAIENFKGTAFPSWMLNISSGLLQHLVKLDLKNCSWCELLPPLGRLPCLTILKVVGMDNVSCISEEFYGTQNGNGDHAFPVLKIFILSRMPKLVEWFGPTPSWMSAFPSLVRLEVEQCPQLTAIPDEVLYWKRMGLRKLRIAHCEKLTKIPAGLRELRSLSDLELFGLPLLRNFSIQGAKKLKRLTIGCFAADINFVPCSLQHFSTLTNLTVWGYDQKELPDWITALPSLQILKLELCKILENFPPVEKMKQLTNLEELNISHCSLLEERCITGGKPEWKKVSHIPTIVVNEAVMHMVPVLPTI